MTDIRRITRCEELTTLAWELGVRSDWHEPDEQDVDARIIGNHLDNAMGSSAEACIVHTASGDHDHTEYNVILTRGGEDDDSRTDVAVINLATLLAWASDSASSVGVTLSDVRKIRSAVIQQAKASADLNEALKCLDTVTATTTTTSAVVTGKSAERHWRMKLADEVCAYAAKLRDECVTPSVGVALAAVVSEMGERIRAMPT